MTEEEESFAKRNVDFSQIPFSAVFVIHDNGMDWGLATQIITEVMASKGGLMGTRRDTIRSDDTTVPLILTNPDVIWGKWVKPLFTSAALTTVNTHYRDSAWAPSG